VFGTVSLFPFSFLLLDLAFQIAATRKSSIFLFSPLRLKTFGDDVRYPAREKVLQISIPSLVFVIWIFLKYSLFLTSLFLEFFSYPIVDNFFSVLSFFDPAVSCVDKVDSAKGTTKLSFHPFPSVSF